MVNDISAVTVRFVPTLVKRLGVPLALPLCTELRNDTLLFEKKKKDGFFIHGVAYKQRFLTQISDGNQS